jgi:hypothetical protein
MFGRWSLEMRTGSQDIAFDRLELDAPVVQCKDRNGRPDQLIEDQLAGNFQGHASR